jgi:hypothetical protein
VAKMKTKRKEKKLRWRNDAKACFANNFLSLSDKIIASKRINWGKAGKIDFYLNKMNVSLYLILLSQFFSLSRFMVSNICAMNQNIEKLLFLPLPLSPLLLLVALSHSTSTTIFILLSEKIRKSLYAELSLY